MEFSNRQIDPKLKPIYVLPFGTSNTDVVKGFMSMLTGYHVENVIVREIEEKQGKTYVKVILWND